MNLAGLLNGEVSLMCLGMNLIGLLNGEGSLIFLGMNLVGLLNGKGSLMFLLFAIIYNIAIWYYIVYNCEQRQLALLLLQWQLALLSLQHSP